MENYYWKGYYWIMQKGAVNGLSMAARTVYCLMYSYYEAGIPIDITEAGTALRLGVNRRTLQRSIKQLLEKGWVTRTMPEGKNRYLYQCKVHEA